MVQKQAQLMEERWVVGKAEASATSWIDGYFLFDNRSLEYIMRELARWYDIDGILRGKHFRIDRLGNDEAFRLACEWRAKMIEQLNFTYFS